MEKGNGAARPGKLRVLLGTFDPNFFNGRNTFRTSLGFIRSLFGIGERADRLEDIFNYLPISEQMVTSGQPTEDQFVLIRTSGFRRIINLAPHEAENALEDEAGLMRKLGVTYVHIPVDFTNPTEADFEAFCNAMTVAGNDKVWVHCAANMRVSAFTYRYRTEILGVEDSVALADLDRIWKPFGVWAAFLGR